MHRLVFLVRYLGLREGFAIWWQALGDRRPAGPDVRLAHGARPSMPDYRRHRR
jgi:hypothetical protein